MQVTVTDYKTNTKGEKVTVDTAAVRSIYSGYSVFDGRSTEGWFVVLDTERSKATESILVSNEDVRLLRTVG